MRWCEENRVDYVLGKAEYLDKGANPRFVMTSLAPEQYDAKTLYESAIRSARNY